MFLLSHSKACGFVKTFRVFACISTLLLSGAMARGQGWQNLGIYGGKVDDLGIDPYNPQHLVAASYWSPFQSYDGGETWTLIHDPNLEPDPALAYLTVFGPTVTFDRRTPGRVYLGRYRSDDSGHTWSVVSGTSRWFFVLAVHPEDSNVLFASKDTFERSETGGDPWYTVISPGGKPLSFSHVAINPNDPSQVVVGAQSTFEARTQGISGAIYESHDSGRTFEPILEGNWGDGVLEPYGLVFDNGSLWAALHDGIYQRRNSQFECVLPMHYGTLPYGFYLTNGPDGVLYALDSRSPDETLFPPGDIHQNHSDLSSEIKLLWKSRTHGQDWEPVATLDDTLKITADPSNADVLYSNSRSYGVMKSENGGKTWREINHGIENTVLYDLARHPNMPNRLIAAGLTGVYISEDNGLTWRTVRYLEASTITYADEQGQTILIGGYWGTSIISRDGGQTWSRQRVDVWPYTRSLCADPTRPGLVYGGGITFEGEVEGGLYISDDYTMTWKRDSSLLVDCNELYLSRVDDGSGDTILFIATVEGLYMRVNEGEVEKLAFTNSPIQNIGGSRADPLKVLVNYGRYLAWVRLQKDAPGQYSLVEEPVFLSVQGVRVLSISDILIYDDNPEHIVLATDKGILESFDRGETWTRDDSLTGVRLVRADPSEIAGVGKLSLKATVSTSGIIAVNDSGAYRKRRVPVGIPDWTNR